VVVSIGRRGDGQCGCGDGAKEDFMDGFHCC
jgi:hypothetical protein